jgi:hypothetical protein
VDEIPGHWALCPQEIFWIDSGLPQNRTECSLGHIARMIRDRCVPVRAWAKPDFVAAGGLTVELEPASLQFPDDLPVSESGQTAH